MTRLMITCPITQKPAFAGIDVPAQVWETMQMANNTIRCEHCGRLCTTGASCTTGSCNS